MKPWLRLSGLWLGLLCACGAGSKDSPQIDDGTYVAGTGSAAETILVRNPTIQFRILVAVNGGTRFIERSYKTYNVAPNGRITLRPIRSSEFLAGIGSFTWRWDGVQITQTPTKNPGAVPKVYQRSNAKSDVPPPPNEG